MKYLNYKVSQLLQEVESDSPAPGGGSVAALCGALAGSLLLMCIRLTLVKKKYEKIKKEFQNIEKETEAICQKLYILIDEDTQAYNAVMSAFKMPKSSNDEKKTRHEQIQASTKRATEVPMETLRSSAHLSKFIATIIDKGNPNCVSDAGVSAQLIRSCALGAAYNVRINLKSLSDTDFRDSMKEETEKLLVNVMEKVQVVENMLDYIEMKPA